MSKPRRTHVGKWLVVDRRGNGAVVAQITEMTNTHVKYNHGGRSRRLPICMILFCGEEEAARELAELLLASELQYKTDLETALAQRLRRDKSFTEMIRERERNGTPQVQDMRQASPAGAAVLP